MAGPTVPPRRRRNPLPPAAAIAQNAPMQSSTAAIGLVVLALAFLVLAVLYAFGAISFLASTPGAPHHYKHAAVLAVLAVGCLIAANFARPKAASPA
jgi:hypothetical protein